MQMLGVLNTYFNYIFGINFKNLETKVWWNVMWKDCFIIMEKHEVKVVKNVFIYKLIHGTTKCMKRFQDVKGFYQTICMKPTPFKLKCCFKMKWYLEKLDSIGWSGTLSLYPLQPGWCSFKWFNSKCVGLMSMSSRSL